ncbi:MAG: hypothetical protein ACR2OB_14030 [Solirubrobacteraceae bacterium]
MPDQSRSLERRESRAGIAFAAAEQDVNVAFEHDSVRRREGQDLALAVVHDRRVTVVIGSMLPRSSI